MAKDKKDSKAKEPIERNTRGLRNLLFDELDALRAGKSNPARVSAVSRAAAAIVNTVRVELAAQRHKVQLADAIEGQVIKVEQPLQLGS